MTCAMCHERDWPYKNSPRCAFRDGRFSSNNWNCATMNRLRALVTDDWDRVHYSEDQFCGVLPFEGDFLVLSWYKRRGKTEGAWIVDEEWPNPLTLDKAKEILDNYGEEIG